MHGQNHIKFVEHLVKLVKISMWFIRNSAMETCE